MAPFLCIGHAGRCSRIFSTRTAAANVQWTALGRPSSETPGTLTGRAGNEVGECLEVVDHRSWAA